MPFYIRVKKDTEVDASEGSYGPAYYLFEDVPVMSERHSTLRMISEAFVIWIRLMF